MGQVLWCWSTHSTPECGLDQRDSVAWNGKMSFWRLGHGESQMLLAGEAVLTPPHSRHGRDAAVELHTVLGHRLGPWR